MGQEKDFEVYITVSQDYARLVDYIHLQQRQTAQEILPQAEGAVVTEKLALLLDLKVGSTVTIRDSAHRTYEMTITGIAENYADHFLYVSDEYYRAVFGAAPEYNSVIMHTTDAQQMRQLKEDLLADTDIMMVSSAADVLEQFSTITENLGAVVAILIISAGLLALAFMGFSGLKIF